MNILLEGLERSENVPGARHESLRDWRTQHLAVMTRSTPMSHAARLQGQAEPLIAFTEHQVGAIAVGDITQIGGEQWIATGGNGAIASSTGNSSPLFLMAVSSIRRPSTGPSPRGQKMREPRRCASRY